MFKQVLVLILLIVTPAVFAAPDTTVYGLIITDTNGDKIGKSVEKDRVHVVEALKNAIPKDKLKLTEITGDDVSVKNIDKWFQDWKGEKKKDVIFVYVATHGAWEDGRGHFFQFKNGDVLYRNHLRRALTFQEARQSVLVSDSCGTRQTLPRVHIVYRPPTEKADFALLRRMLQDGEGLKDVNAASRGESAYGNDEFGGFFTFHFLRTIAANPRGDFGFDAITDTTAKAFSDWIPKDTTQVPYKFHASRMNHYENSFLRLKNFDPEKTLRVRVALTFRGLPVEPQEFEVGPNAMVETKLFGSAVTISVRNERGVFVERETLSLVPRVWNAYTATAQQTVTYYFPAALPVPRPFPR